MKGIDDKIISSIFSPFGYLQYYFENDSIIKNKIILLNGKSRKALFILPH